jgi:hypothetical protein
MREHLEIAILKGNQIPSYGILGVQTFKEI